MRERILAETENVRGAKKCVAYLQDRPKTEMVGLGLLYGAPGLGKTISCQTSTPAIAISSR